MIMYYSIFLCSFYALFIWLNIILFREQPAELLYILFQK